MNNYTFKVNDVIIYESNKDHKLLLSKGVITNISNNIITININDELLDIIDTNNLYPLNYYSNNNLVNNYIKVIIVKPYCEPSIEYIENSLETLQDIVKGLIELLILNDKVDLLCNEEGKLLSLKPNRRIGEDIIAGNFILLSSNNEGEFISLDNDSIKSCYERFKRIEIYSQAQVEESLLMRFIEF